MPPFARRHDIDALRFLVFVVLILYHTAMLYIANEHWHLKSSYQSDWLEWPMALVNRWRMELVFLISGVSTAMMMAARRETAKSGFVRKRALRLLLPLLFGMAIVVPLQPYCQGVANGLIVPGFGHFLLNYYSRYRWPADAFDGWQYGFTWNHLWYLAYLLAYTLILFALQPVLDSPIGQRLARWFAGLRGAWLLSVPALPLAVATIVLKPLFSETHALVDDWFLHAIYFTVFLYGWWFGRSDVIWRELARLRCAASMLAIACFVAYVCSAKLGIEDSLAWAMISTWPLRNLYAWLAICAILGWSHHLLNRPFTWLPWARQSVYPWYILHQSLIVPLAYWLVPLKLGPVVEPLLIFGLTIVGCWLGTDLVITRIGWLRPCFGLDRAGAPEQVKRSARQCTVTG